MNAENEQLLAQLQDIHAAAAPGWWPPAPGWWALGGLLLVLVILLIRLLARKWALARRRKKFLDTLDLLARDCDPAEKPHEYLAAINRLFRAVALKAFPGTGCARLEGEEWVVFIRSLLPEQAAVGLEVLARGPYEPLPQFDAAALDRSFRTWVKKYG